MILDISIKENKKKRKKEKKKKEKNEKKFLKEIRHCVVSVVRRNNQ